MAIPNPNPHHNGEEYPFLSVELALSTRAAGNDMELGLVVTLTPYRVTASGVQFLSPYLVIEDGVERYESGKTVMVFGNAMTQAQSDPRLAKFLATIESAGHEYILGGVDNG